MPDIQDIFALHLHGSQRVDELLEENRGAQARRSNLGRAGPTEAREID